jgi:hypothetical protein
MLTGENIYKEIQGTGSDGGENLSVNSQEEAAAAMRNFATQTVVSPPYTPATSLSEGPMSDGSVESIRSFGGAQSAVKHLHFPMHEIVFGLARDDVQGLIDARNLFAFLTYQPLIATRKYPSLFRILLQAAAILKKLEFTNMDGSTFGEAAQSSTSFYVEERQLADVRRSREATLEGIILGEALRSATLYNEAYTHAVGKWAELQTINSPLLKELPAVTRSKLEQSSQYLNNALKTAKGRLADFEYPSLFAGIGSSTTVAEAKLIKFKSWKSNYFALRKVVMSYCRSQYGQWPPKASVKRRTVGGLNRLVLRGLYDDFSSLYDYLVDRTTRNLGTTGKQEDFVTATTGLRKLLGEFDNATPPVQPPIPFDIPLIPTMQSIEPKHNLLGPKDQTKANTRKLKDNEIGLIMAKSHNFDSKHKTPFMEMFKSFEEKESKGKNVDELTEQRCGHWIFIYAVLQSLPIIISDAPGIQFTGGVEYFLCQQAMGASPWLEENVIPKSWYQVGATGGLSFLADDVVERGVEAKFQRTHCWEMAGKWIELDTKPSQPSAAPMSPLRAPPAFGCLGSDVELAYRPSVRSRNRRQSTGDEREETSPMTQPRSYSANRDNIQQRKRDSVALGLEKRAGWPSPTTDAYAGPWGGSASSSRSGSPMMVPGGRRNSSMGNLSLMESRPGSSGSAAENSGHTFDDILKKIDAKDAEKKGKKK